MSKPTQFSASQIKDYLLCNRRWFYNKILKHPRPTTESLSKGLRYHHHVENYYKHGTPITEEPYRELFEAAKPYLPKRTEGFEIEKYFSIPVLQDQVKLIGRIDLYTKGYIIDHKTCSSFRYLPLQSDLKKDIQAIIYAKANVLEFDVAEVLSKWVYVCVTKNNVPKGSKVVNVTLDRDYINEEFDKLLPIMEKMLEIKNKQEIEMAECNTSSCFAYGKCPFWDLCPRANPVKPNIDLVSLFPNKKTISFCYDRKRVLK